MLLGLQDTKFEGVGTKTPHNSPRNSVSATSKFTMVGTKTPHNSPRNSVSVTSKFTRVGTKTPHNSRRNSVSVTSKLTRVGTKTPHASLLTSNSSLLHGLQVGIYFISMIYIKTLWHQTSLRQKVCHKIFLVSKQLLTTTFTKAMINYRITTSTQ